MLGKIYPSFITQRYADSVFQAGDLLQGQSIAPRGLPGEAPTPGNERSLVHDHVPVLGRTTANCFACHAVEVAALVVSDDGTAEWQA